MTQPQFFQLLETDTAALRREAVAGLLVRPATCSPKFFYDALGSRLFDAITELDEYYPTRTEVGILRQQQARIAATVHARLGAAPTLLDLGAGNCAKAASLFAALQPSHYVALDISVEFLRAALNSLQQQHPAVRMTGLGLDFSSQLSLPAGVLDGPTLCFYPGSSIGNFSPDAALTLLRQVRGLVPSGALLIGVDLVKPAAVLEAAYDDALGVTAAFNLNLLRHLNRLIGSDFRPREWRHVALYRSGSASALTGRIEMHLEARHALTVNWPGGERRFESGERIHTENSYKWPRSDFEALLRDAGFGQVQCFSDEAGWFGVFLAT